MKSLSVFIAEILLVSAAFSVLLKYGFPLIAIAPTPINAIVAIAVLPVLMAVALLWRSLLEEGRGQK